MGAHRHGTAIHNVNSAANYRRRSNAEVVLLLQARFGAFGSEVWNRAPCPDDYSGVAEFVSRVSLVITCSLPGKRLLVVSGR